MKRALLLFGVPLACALLAWTAGRAQQPKPTPASVSQYAFEAKEGEWVEEVKKANEKGLTVTLSTCKRLGSHLLCLADKEDYEEEEGR